MLLSLAIASNTYELPIEEIRPQAVLRGIIRTSATRRLQELQHIRPIPPSNFQRLTLQESAYLTGRITQFIQSELPELATILPPSTLKKSPDHSNSLPTPLKKPPLGAYLNRGRRYGMPL